VTNLNLNLNPTTEKGGVVEATAGRQEDDDETHHEDDDGRFGVRRSAPLSYLTS
jgi:hypothetical protein